MAVRAVLSRRAFLAFASAATAGGILAACGGSAASPASPSGASSAPKPASPASASGAPKPAAGSGDASGASKPAASPAASAAPKPGAGPAGASAQGADPTLKVAYPVITGAQMPLMLADSLGFFNQQHVKVTSQFIEGSISVSALLAKEVDVLLQAAATVLTADINGSADLVYVASAYNQSQFSLMVAPAIKTAADLKGKPWGNDRPGTTTDYYTRVLLPLLGLKATDVEQRALGNNAVLLTALLGGQVQAAPLSPPATFQAETAGFHSLKDTFDIPYQSVGVVVSRARIPELTPALLRFLVAYRQGMQAYTQQPDAAKKLLQQYGKIEDQATLDKSYTFYVNQTHFQLDLQPTMVGIQQMLDFLSDSIPAAKNAKPEQFVDTRLLGQLPKV
jgi:NitT/TauT family transport system substrate-binding protein